MSSSPITTNRRSITRDPRRMGLPIHPGEILIEDFLRPLGLSQAQVVCRLFGIVLGTISKETRGHVLDCFDELFNLLALT